MTSIQPIRPLHDLFQHLSMYHSEFQIDEFIVGCQVTDFARFRQAIRELWTRVVRTKQLYLDRQACEIHMRSNVHQGLYLSGDAKLLNDIEYKKLEIQLDDILFTIRESEREVKRFWALASALRDALPEVLDEETVHALEKDRWVWELGRTIATAQADGEKIPDSIKHKLESFDPSMSRMVLACRDAAFDQTMSPLRFRPEIRDHVNALAQSFNGELPREIEQCPPLLITPSEDSSKIEGASTSPRVGVSNVETESS